MTVDSSSVRDNPSRQRFELQVGDRLAFLDYRRHGAALALVHAEVPRELEGRGIGSALVRGSLELARTAGERVLPQCPFVARFMERHPEYEDLRASGPAR